MTKNAQAHTPQVQEQEHSAQPVSFRHYWYIACQSHELKPGQVIQREILNEWIALFRNAKGRPVALQDRCPHRNYKLSRGRVYNGQLQCTYHGWIFDDQGQVVAIPSESPSFKPLKSRCAHRFDVLEQDDLIYVRLESHPDIQDPPLRMPHYKEKGYRTQRLFNVFRNNVTNCAENYVDVPHTVFVHNGIFRVSRNEKIAATVLRKEGYVAVDYHNETNNMGWFSFFLNPGKQKIIHRDFFFAPNVTHVEYIFPPDKEFYITSHCTPVNDHLTHVYTDLTYRFGIFNIFAGPIVRFQGQSVINQDIAVLDTQMEVIQKYGERFSHASADIVHILIESLRNAIAKGQNPRTLSEQRHDFEFWI